MKGTSLSLPSCEKIELHVLSLADNHDDYKNAWGMISKSESERLKRLVDPSMRRRSLVARAGLRKVLGAYLNVAPAQVELSYTDYGKPVLRDVALQFSLSHSREVAVIAVTAGARVGVDIEHVDRCHVGRLPTRAMTRSEIATWERMPGSARCAAFLRYWTAKEAYTKAVGAGLHVDLREVEIADALTKPAFAGANANQWAVGHFDPREDVIGAVVAEKIVEASLAVMGRAYKGAMCGSGAPGGA
jgi:4'-phosphopantetheinyl transferase